MGAAATMSKDHDETCGQKPATSLKSENCNNTAKVVICSGCKTSLNIFKRKVCCIFIDFNKLFNLSVSIHAFNIVESIAEANDMMLAVSMQQHIHM